MAEVKKTMGKKEAIIDALSSFIQQRRKLLLVVFLIIVAGLAGLIIALQLRKGKEEVSFVQLEEVQKSFAQWMSAMDESDKGGAAADTKTKAADLEKEVTDKAGVIIAAHRDLYSGIRAQDILASVLYRKKEYEKAAEAWKALADSRTAGYLAPIALCNAAAAWEDAGKPEAAEKSFNEVLARFSKSFPDIPRVLFSLGRLAEGRQAYSDAKGFYDRIINEYSASSWTKLAYNRIISLEVQKKITK